jgi:hypothetical protein
MIFKIVSKLGLRSPERALYSLSRDRSDPRATWVITLALQPHWGEQLPGNDGGLALSQIWAARLGVSMTPAEKSQADA